MIGDKLAISALHRENGRRIADLVTKRRTKGRFAITIAGESGSGKTESAVTTAEALQQQGLKVQIFGQDDYFRLPPKSNEAKRRNGMDWVGPGEVHLELMDSHLQAFKEGATQLTKPLVDFDADSIGEETVQLANVDVVIAEGTYTTLLQQADLHIFLSADFEATLAHRKKRARDDVDSPFIIQVLEIEHGIISKHAEQADLIL